MKRTYGLLMAALNVPFLLAFTISSAASSATSTSYSVPAQVIASAGHSPTSGLYSIRGIAGQSLAIGCSTSATYTVSHGFLYLEGSSFLPNRTYSAGLQDGRNGRGVAWGDFDGDGNQDVYVARGASPTNDLLFENTGGSSCTNTTIARGIVECMAGSSVSWSDIDADGDLDAYVRNTEGTAGILWRNLGSSGFTNVTASAGLACATVGVSAVWTDYDGDGLPDLFMASTNGQLPHLYHNEGVGTFSRVDSSMGLTNTTWGSGVWGDYDNDGDPDLFVAQGNGQTDLLYRNLGGTGFVEVAASCGMNVIDESFGASWGDYDNDGWLDLYVINTGTNCDALYRNSHGTFTNVTGLAGISDELDGRSAGWCDFDADGDLDLYVANCGTNGQPDIIYYNDGDGTFTRSFSPHHKRSYGVAWGDYNGDNAPDMIVTHEDESLSLLRNDNSGSWLRVRPLNGNGYETAHGSQVRLYLAGTTNIVAMRQVDGGHGTGCQDAYDVYFGIPAGDTNRYDIEVRFALRGDPLGTGTAAAVVVNKTINPDLGDVLPEDVGSGHVEVRENGRVFVAQGTLFVSGNEVWLLQNSGAVRKLTSAGGAEPAGSPDGGKFVFTSDRNGTSDLFVKLITGGVAQPFVTNAWNVTQPAWATDNSGVAFVSDQGGNKEICVVDIGGDRVRNLTEHPSNDWDASWSPNSAKIAFVSDRNGYTNIWIMDYDGANATNLTDTPTADVEPAWSPDGLHIAFMSFRDTNAEIYVMNFDGTSPTRLTWATNSTERHPTWNDDGSQIIFESDVSGIPRLYTCDPDGRNMALLTPTMEARTPSFPMSYKYPPRSVVFGEKNGRITYWADPVNTEGGNLTIAETDFILTGRGEPIRFARFYNSQDPFDSPMGYGWRHSYMIELTRELNGNVTITWGDGHKDFYQPFGSNTFTRIFGTTPGVLVETETGFAFTRPDQTVYEFTIAGRLVSTTDKNGNTISLTYSADHLVTVSQPNGRDLSFGYSSNRLANVTDHAGRGVAFAYDSDGDLVTYTNVRRHAWQYTYDDNHRLTSKVDPRGTVVVTNEYGAVGRVVRQWDANGALTTYAYSRDVTNNTSTTSVTDPLGRVVKHTYDAFRRLIKVTGSDDEDVLYSYDPFGNRAQAVDRSAASSQYTMTPAGMPTVKLGPDTNTVRIKYDQWNNPSAHMNELGDLTAYSYDQDGNLSAVTNALGDVASTDYNEHGQPVSTTDENGNDTVLEYDANGDLTTIVDAMGRRTVLTYDALGRVRSRTDPESNTWVYAYTENNLLCAVTNPAGGVTLYTYDAADRLVSARTKLTEATWAVVSNIYDDVGRVVAVIDPRGNTTSYGYDAFGNQTVVTNALGGVTRRYYDADNQGTNILNAAMDSPAAYEYDKNGLLVRSRLPGVGVTRYTHNTMGNVVALSNAWGHARHYEHDAMGRVISVADERGETTRRVYDAVGRVVAVTNALGHSMTYQYDKAGNLVRTTDPNGNSVRYGYNDVNKVTAVTNALGHVTAFVRDGNNRVTAVVDAMTNTTRYAYDPVGRLVRITYPDGNSVSNAYDLGGRLVSVADAAGHTETYEYNVAGNRTRKTDRLGLVTRWEYDALGRMTAVTDPKGRVTRYGYDPVGRLTNVVDTLGNSVSFRHDGEGRLEQTIGPRGGVEIRTYDGLGRLASAADPLGRTKRYEYDSRGSLTNFVAADGKSTRYEYDALGRLTRAFYPDFTTATYTYDAAGRLMAVVDSNGTTSNRYDGLNRLIARTDVYGKTVGYEYDAVGNRTAIIYPDGRRVDYRYDSMGRMIQVTDWMTNVTSYTYDRIGSLTVVSNANDTRCVYTYDDQQRLVSQRNEKADGALIAEQTFTRDNVGNITREQRDYPAMPSPAEGDTSYSYDIADQMAALSGTAVVHDARGNLTQTAGAQYEYDHANRLVNVDCSGGFAEYTYDHAGNRIGKTAWDGQSFVQQRYTVDVNSGLPSVLTEDEKWTGEEQAYYVYGLGLISRITPNGNVRTYHYDHVGSTLALTDESGDVTDSYVYDPFGAVSGAAGDSPQPYRFVGRYGVADERNGLLFMRARYYGVAEGRFLGLDPILSDSYRSSHRSAYVYAVNSPTGYTDPSGEAAAEILAIVATVVLAYELVDSLYMLGVYGEEGPMWSGIRGTVHPVVGLAGTIDRFMEEPGKIKAGFAAGASGTSAHDFMATDPSSHSFAGDYMYLQAAIVRRIADGVRGDASVCEAAENEPLAADRTYLDLVMGNHVFDAIGEYAADNDKDSLGVESFAGELPAESPSTYGDWRDRRKEKQIIFAEPPRTWDDIADVYARRMARFFAPHEKKQAQMEASIQRLTRGRGWSSLSGQHGENYSTVTFNFEYGPWRKSETRTFLTGYWYWNVSRCVELAVPRPTHATWLAAHAAARSAVRDSLARNYTANGVNTPWIPEVYEAYVIDGKFAVYGK